MTKFDEWTLDVVETDIALLEEAEELILEAALAYSPCNWFADRYFVIDVNKFRCLIDQCEDPELLYGLDIEHLWKLSEITDRIFSKIALLKGTL